MSLVRPFSKRNEKMVHGVFLVSWFCRLSVKKTFDKSRRITNERFGVIFFIEN